jgi:hypothetical protein
VLTKFCLAKEEFPKLSLVSMKTRVNTIHYEHRRIEGCVLLILINPPTICEENKNPKKLTQFQSDPQRF